jgi:hemolysin III
LEQGYARPERIADAVVHMAGMVLGLVGCIVLAAVALPRGSWLLLASLGLYTTGLLAMLGCSALYNMTPSSNWTDLFRRLDHAAIFVMIAGTYTPFALVAIGDDWGLGLFAFVWLTAAGGVMLKLVWPRRLERLSIVLYLLLGWSVLAVLEPLFGAVSLPGIVLLAAGGILFTVGVVFHLWERLPYHKAIWHVLVLAAAACHYAAVLGEVALAG